MRTIRRQAKATSLDHAIELAKQHAKEQHRPSKVMADLMGVELKTYYRWLLDNTLPLNRIAQFEALTGSRFISEYLSVLHGDQVVIEIPRGRKGKAADMAQVQSQTAAALALLAEPAHVIGARPALRLHPAGQLPQGSLLRHGRVPSPDGNGAAAICLLLQHPQRTACLSRPRGRTAPARMGAFCRQPNLDCEQHHQPQFELRRPPDL